VHTFCRRRKSTAERLGRSPGSEVQSVLCGCFTFPGRWPSGRTKQRPHSQWRDRAGFAPDFPVMPVVGTQTRSALYHDRVNAANLWTHTPWCGRTRRGSRPLNPRMLDFEESCYHPARKEGFALIDVLA